MFPLRRFQHSRRSALIPAGNPLRLQKDWEITGGENVLQLAVVFIERTAPAQIKQYIPLFYPYIHADISTAAGH